jgi:hypothetical protein
MGQGTKADYWNGGIIEEWKTGKEKKTQSNHENTNGEGVGCFRGE